MGKISSNIEISLRLINNEFREVLEFKVLQAVIRDERLVEVCVCTGWRAISGPLIAGWTTSRQLNRKCSQIEIFNYIFTLVGEKNSGILLDSSQLVVADGFWANKEREVVEIRVSHCASSSNSSEKRAAFFLRNRALLMVALLRGNCKKSRSQNSETKSNLKLVKRAKLTNLAQWRDCPVDSVH